MTRSFTFIQDKFSIADFGLGEIQMDENSFKLRHGTTDRLGAFSRGQGSNEIVAMTVASIRTLQKRDGDSRFDRQSKTCELSRSIENLKIGGAMKYIIGLLVVFVTLVASGAVVAQQPAKMAKIGVLVSSTQALNAPRDEALRRGLRDFGYEEGKNIVMDYKYAEGKPERFAQLAKELVAEKPDVIVVGGTAVAVAAKNATSTIPIVVAGAGDLVEAGLIKSFMYPGGNVTGVARMSADFFGDRFKLIKEILPKASQVAALSNPNNLGHGRSVKEAELGARSLGLTFKSVAARSANELDGAISSAAKDGASALFIMTDAMFNSQVARIANLTIKHRLPAVYDRTDFVEAGGLASYGVDLPDLSRRAAEYVDQILKGKKPGDLTLVQPTKFDLAVNLKTADQIGVTIPPSVLSRASKVIK
jgi:putative tryptophan/tyrosine transport system substrate-binding protein